MLDFGFYNMDCMEAMREFPDGYFDLAVVDPPYGIGVEINMGRKRTGDNRHHQKQKWDSKAPSGEYFDELFRVSKNQVIWGGNYFTLPPTRGFIIWDKKQPEGVSFASCEFAWTSFDRVAKTFYHYPVDLTETRIHPTQKPVALYEWILTRYASDGDIILDTHVGSASSLIACHNTGHKFVGFELDPDYYAAAKARLEAVQAQTSLFDMAVNA